MSSFVLLALKDRVDELTANFQWYRRRYFNYWLLFVVVVFFDLIYRGRGIFGGGLSVSELAILLFAPSLVPAMKVASLSSWFVAAGVVSTVYFIVGALLGSLLPHRLDVVRLLWYISAAALAFASIFVFLQSWQSTVYVTLLDAAYLMAMYQLHDERQNWVAASIWYLVTIGLAAPTLFSATGLHMIMYYAEMGVIALPLILQRCGVCSLEELDEDESSPGDALPLPPIFYFEGGVASSSSSSSSASGQPPAAEALSSLTKGLLRGIDFNGFRWSALQALQEYRSVGGERDREVSPADVAEFDATFKRLNLFESAALEGGEAYDRDRTKWHLFTQALASNAIPIFAGLEGGGRGRQFLNAFSTSLAACLVRALIEKWLDSLPLLDGEGYKSLLDYSPHLRKRGKITSSSAGSAIGRSCSSSSSSGSSSSSSIFERRSAEPTFLQELVVTLSASQKQGLQTQPLSKFVFEEVLKRQRDLAAFDWLPPTLGMAGGSAGSVTLEKLTRKGRIERLLLVRVKSAQLLSSLDSAHWPIVLAAASPSRSDEYIINPEDLSGRGGERLQFISILLDEVPVSEKPKKTMSSTTTTTTTTVATNTSTTTTTTTTTSTPGAARKYVAYVSGRDGSSVRVLDTSSISGDLGAFTVLGTRSVSTLEFRRAAEAQAYEDHPIPVVRTDEGTDEGRISFYAWKVVAVFEEGICHDVRMRSSILPRTSTYDDSAAANSVIPEAPLSFSPLESYGGSAPRDRSPPGHERAGSDNQRHQHPHRSSSVPHSPGRSSMKSRPHDPIAAAASQFHLSARASLLPSHAEEEGEGDHQLQLLESEVVEAPRDAELDEARAAGSEEFAEALAQRVAAERPGWGGGGGREDERKLEAINILLRSTPHLEKRIRATCKRLGLAYPPGLIDAYNHSGLRLRVRLALDALGMSEATAERDAGFATQGFLSKWLTGGEDQEDAVCPFISKRFSRLIMWLNQAADWLEREEGGGEQRWQQLASFVRPSNDSLTHSMALTPSQMQTVPPPPPTLLHLTCPNGLKRLNSFPAYYLPDSLDKNLGLSLPEYLEQREAFQVASLLRTAQSILLRYGICNKLHLRDRHYHFCLTTMLGLLTTNDNSCEAPTELLFTIIEWAREGGLWPLGDGLLLRDSVMQHDLQKAGAALIFFFPKAADTVRPQSQRGHAVFEGWAAIARRLEALIEERVTADYAAFKQHLEALKEVLQPHRALLLIEALQEAGIHSIGRLVLSFFNTCKPPRNPAAPVEATLETPPLDRFVTVTRCLKERSGEDLGTLAISALFSIGNTLPIEGNSGSGSGSNSSSGSGGGGAAFSHTSSPLVFLARQLGIPRTLVQTNDPQCGLPSRNSLTALIHLVTTTVDEVTHSNPFEEDVVQSFASAERSSKAQQHKHLEEHLRDIERMWRVLAFSMSDERWPVGAEMSLKQDTVSSLRGARDALRYLFPPSRTSLCADVAGQVVRLRELRKMGGKSAFDRHLSVLSKIIKRKVRMEDYDDILPCPEVLADLEEKGKGNLERRICQWLGFEQDCSSMFRSRASESELLIASIFCQGSDRGSGSSGSGSSSGSATNSAQATLAGPDMRTLLAIYRSVWGLKDSERLRVLNYLCPMPPLFMKDLPSSRLDVKTVFLNTKRALHTYFPHYGESLNNGSGADSARTSRLLPSACDIPCLPSFELYRILFALYCSSPQDGGGAHPALAFYANEQQTAVFAAVADMREVCKRLSAALEALLALFPKKFSFAKRVTTAAAAGKNPASEVKQLVDGIENRKNDPSLKFAIHLKALEDVLRPDNARSLLQALSRATYAHLQERLSDAIKTDSYQGSRSPSSLPRIGVVPSDESLGYFIQSLEDLSLEGDEFVFAGMVRLFLHGTAENSTLATEAPTILAFAAQRAAIADAAFFPRNDRLFRTLAEKLGVPSARELRSSVAAWLQTQTQQLGNEGDSPLGEVIRASYASPSNLHCLGDLQALRGTIALPRKLLAAQTVPSFDGGRGGAVSTGSVIAAALSPIDGLGMGGGAALLDQLQSMDLAPLLATVQKGSDKLAVHLYCQSLSGRHNTRMSSKETISLGSNDAIGLWPSPPIASGAAAPGDGDGTDGDGAGGVWIAKRSLPKGHDDADYDYFTRVSYRAIGGPLEVQLACCWGNEEKRCKSVALFTKIPQTLLEDTRGGAETPASAVVQLPLPILRLFRQQARRFADADEDDAEPETSFGLLSSEGQESIATFRKRLF